MKPIIEIKGIGKKYDITHQRGKYIAMRDIIMNVLKAPFSFLKTRAKRAVGLESKEEFWALKDVSFTVKKGEVVGIIGSNGAGKSTLLKILSQITPPTTGEIRIRGRVGSLLEVGTGFHPELTGRENIFLNGAILGMSKKEIAEKFDQIVEFAGIEKFLDTVVKHYSSGMYVRLAFSVAAHMNHDILIIDEVLAVGDAEFQKKCLGKMGEITKNEGRTILFVSHNLEAIKSLCTRSILLQNGKLTYSGETKDVVDKYLGSPRISDLAVTSLKDRKKRSTGAVQFRDAKATKDGKECWNFKHDEEILLTFTTKVIEDVPNLLFGIALLDPNTKIVIGNFFQNISHKPLHVGEEMSFEIHIPPNTLRPGEFLLNIDMTDDRRSVWYDVLDANVGLPALHIAPIENGSQNENEGLFIIPATLKNIRMNKETKINE